MSNLSEIISKLRGTSGPQKETKPQTNQDQLNAKYEAYAKLDDHQFALALGAAYDNFARLEHLNTPDNVKAEVLGEIGLVLAEAKKRFPNATPEPTKGSYYKDPNVANMEQQLIPYMREAAKSNPLLRDDVHRYESWRNGADATIMTGTLTVKEMPFENFARYASPDDKTAFTAEINHFRNPYESGNKILSQKDIAIEKAKLAKLHIH